VEGPDGNLIGLAPAPDPSGGWLVNEDTLTARQPGRDAPDVPRWAEHYPTCPRRPRARAATPAEDRPGVCARCQGPLDPVLTVIETRFDTHPACDTPPPRPARRTGGASGSGDQWRRRRR